MKRQYFFSFLLVLLSFLLTSASALAEETSASCKQERSQLCAELKGKRLKACLKEKSDQLSQACRPEKKAAKASSKENMEKGATKMKTKKKKKKSDASA